ncbi:hypothetical protein [Rhodoplanes azumiensis]|uniref:Uncharacterized protein n=1 Tax=Rhodoplanes azumiensis TaxID=1897628 RepID=A0ABW5AL86_9BRAD
MTNPVHSYAIGPAPPDDETALRRRIAGLRRRSDHLSTLLFCLVCCLDVIADGLVEHALAEHGQTENGQAEHGQARDGQPRDGQGREARALLARIEQVKTEAASARQRLHETERLLHGRGRVGDVAWHV